MRPRARHSVLFLGHSGFRAGIHAAGNGLQSSPERRALSGQSGFTLLELLVVLVLIGLVAGTVGPNFYDAAQRMAGRNDEQKIRQQLNALPLAALHQQKQLVINGQSAPFPLPHGWRLSAERPVIYQPNGVCLGGTAQLWLGRQKRQITLQAPFCQWSSN